MAECNIQTAKNIFKKVIEDKKDIYLALLLYRNMEIDNIHSPSEILTSELKPKIINTSSYNKYLDSNRDQMTQQYNNKGTKSLSQLINSTKIYVQTKPGANWSAGIVLNKTKVG